MIDSKLLLWVASNLNPNNLFSAFDTQKSLCFTLWLNFIQVRHFFLENELLALKIKLDIFISEMCSNNEFSQLKGSN